MDAFYNHFPFRFQGFFLAAFLRDTQEEFFKRVDASLKEANVAAAISVERPGSMSSVPTLNEVRERSGQFIRF
jgi:sugar/nucleoside kinase (ribokinase family)